MKVGTMVMLNLPVQLTFIPECPPNGAIGEVLSATPLQILELKIGEVAVNFPRHPSTGNSTNWRVPVKYLIPISGPDIEMDATTERYNKEKV